MRRVGTFAEIYEEHKFIDKALFALFNALPVFLVKKLLLQGI